MTALPEKASKAWEDREGPIILSTVDGDGNPNAIYATCVSKFSEEIISAVKWVDGTVIDVVRKIDGVAK